MAEKDEMVDKSITNRIIQILFKSQKSLEIVKNQRFEAI